MSWEGTPLLLPEQSEFPDLVFPDSISQEGSEFSLDLGLLEGKQSESKLLGTQESYEDPGKPPRMGLSLQ